MFETQPKINLITFSLKTLVTEVSISANQTYYFDNAQHQTYVSVDNQTLSMSYQEIGKQLQFRTKLAPKTPELITSISIIKVMQEQRVLTLK
ncbi:MAG: hypothetical protein DRR08_11090 [Candidatus Parabeggiatoa sp. nov. 2]|nr:MAG: hypothetical protein B6247_03590 [Beggiatoa sp. 4572_84]RKZ60522.1 MAG: hypothetical protein DRR08_11090 [Gammaproteobacteria bacterium]